MTVRCDAVPWAVCRNHDVIRSSPLYVLAASHRFLFLNKSMRICFDKVEEVERKYCYVRDKATLTPFRLSVTSSDTWLLVLQGCISIFNTSEGLKWLHDHDEHWIRSLRYLKYIFSPPLSDTKDLLSSQGDRRKASIVEVVRELG